MIFNPSMSSHSVKRIGYCTRCLRCFVLEHSIFKTKCLGRLLWGLLQGFVWVEILGLSISEFMFIKFLQCAAMRNCTHRQLRRLLQWKMKILQIIFKMHFNFWQEYLYNWRWNIKNVNSILLQTLIRIYRSLGWSLVESLWKDFEEPSSLLGFANIPKPIWIQRGELT